MRHPRAVQGVLDTAMTGVGALDGLKVPLRQTEGLMASVIVLMGLTISAPDHTTVSRRAVTVPVIQSAQVPQGQLHVLIDSTGLQIYGTGQWLEAKHGAKSRRKWRKLHLAVNAANGMIVAQTLTDQDADDPSQVAPLTSRRCRDVPALSRFFGFRVPICARRFRRYRGL
jgi:Transposase DDE domain